MKKLADHKKTGPDLAMERHWQAMGFRHIAGIDEAGRGPLAGPVVAAAVILDLDHIPLGLDDSKKLSEAKRLLLFDEIIAKAKSVAIASVSAEAIDCMNIRQATLLAMVQAAIGLTLNPDFHLIDGRDVPPALSKNATAYIGGDGRSISIAAASIVAKTIRDRMMKTLPDATYGMAQHMGYGTAQHRTAIITMGGIERLHRWTFAPLKEQKKPA